MSDLPNLYSTARTAQILDVSTETVKRWYKWYESSDWEKPVGLTLPKYIVNNVGTRFFTMESIQELAQFKTDLQGKYRGCMSDFNSYYQWGTRGKAIKKRKEKKNK